jgi:hypothetical protein
MWMIEGELGCNLLMTALVGRMWTKTDHCGMLIWIYLMFVRGVILDIQSAGNLGRRRHAAVFGTISVHCCSDTTM